MWCSCRAALVESGVVRDRRIELLPSVWKTDVLPLNYSRQARNSCWWREVDYSGHPALRPSGAAPLSRRVQDRSCDPLDNQAGGGRWIRTTEGVSQQIYSLPPLAAWVSLQQRTPIVVSTRKTVNTCGTKSRKFLATDIDLTPPGPPETTRVS